MKTNKILAIGVIALSLGLSGCKTVNHDNMASSDHADQVKQLKEKITSQETELNRVKGLLDTNNSNARVSAPVVEDTMLPPNAKAGECYARVLTPATYRTVSKEVIKKRKSSKIEIIPATYKTVTKQVLVKEASETIKTIPATYEWVQEQVLVSAESTKLKTYPAQYGEESEQILIKPAYTTWKKGRGPIEQIDNSTGEIMCLVEVPAEYKTITSRVVVSEPRTETTVIPAVYKTVKKKVQVTPAKVVKTPIPAEYRTVNVKQVDTPPRKNVIGIPAVYDTIVQQEKVTSAEMKWRPILCETNTTKGIVTRIQTALDKAGYNPGNIDGVLGSSTMSALSSFQKDNGMASGQLTMAALKKLGVI